MSFSGSVKGFGKKALGNSDKVRRASSLELFRLIQVSTPVDQGVLINEWRTNVGTPETSPRGIASASGAEAQAESLANLGKLTDTIFYTNNMPYAYGIEYDGKSKYKAPLGMVRINTIKWDRIVKAKAAAYL